MTREEFEVCIKMIRSKDSMTYEEGYSWIQEHINSYFPEIVQLMKNEQDPDLRAKFVEIIGDSMNEKSIPILSQELKHPDYGVRCWAWNSLNTMNMRFAQEIADSYKAQNPNEDFYS